MKTRSVVMAVFAALLLLSACGGTSDREDVQGYQNIGVAVTCQGCPELRLETTAGRVVVSDQAFPLRGQAYGNPVGITYRVYDGLNSYTGPIYATSSGEFDVWLPLFCAENLVEVYFSNQFGVTIWRQIVTPDYCGGVPEEVQRESCYL